MKKILYSVIVMTIILLQGCSGFLDEKNKANVTSDEFYKTAPGFASLLNTTYSSLRTIYDGEPLTFMTGTDLYIVYYARDLANQALAQYKTLEPNNSDVKDFYYKLFAAIGTTNNVFGYSETTAKTAILNQQIAEARFLRAYYYFLLVQQFGGVPIVTTMTSNVILEFPQNTEEEVYNFVITELETAKADLIAKASGATYGRVDQRTANFFLAKAYLTRGWKPFAKADDFAKAKSYADLAIAGQDFTLTFEQAYSPKNYTYRNNEVIWSCLYSPTTMETSTSGNMQASLFGGYLDGAPAENKPSAAKFNPTIYAHWLFSKDIVDPNKDCRYDLTFMEYVFDKSLVWYSKSKEELLATTAIRGYYPTWWKADYKNMTKEEWMAKNPELRKFQIGYRWIDNPGDPYTEPEKFAEATTKWVENSVNNYFFPTFRKFDCPEIGVFNTRASYRDVNLACLGEAYLIAAEAAIKANDQASAAEYINKLRRRSIAADDPKREITPAQATIDFVLEERGRELLGDYSGRWYDLARTGTLVERAVKFNPDLDGNPDYFKGQDGNLKLLRPIPQDAIDANKSQIKQNPGYL